MRTPIGDVCRCLGCEGELGSGMLVGQGGRFLPQPWQEVRKMFLNGLEARASAGRVDVVGERDAALGMILLPRLLFAP